MGICSKISSVTLRFLELAFASVVAGLLGRFLHWFTVASVFANSRVVYTEVIAGISILVSIILMPPLKYSFYCFAFDFVLFICWMVAFGLLENLTAGQGCHSYWYWSSWGYYWGGYWYYIPPYAVTQPVVGTAACAKWNTVLAMSFIGSWLWFASGAVGLFVSFANAEDESAWVNRQRGRAPPENTAVPADGAFNPNIPAETTEAAKSMA